jgi:hypothetical protein
MIGKIAERTHNPLLAMDNIQISDGRLVRRCIKHLPHLQRCRLHAPITRVPFRAVQIVERPILD